MQHAYSVEFHGRRHLRSPQVKLTDFLRACCHDWFAVLLDYHDRLHASQVRHRVGIAGSVIHPVDIRQVG